MIIKQIDKKDYNKVIILGNTLFSLKNDCYRPELSTIIDDKVIFVNVKSKDGTYQLSNREIKCKNIH